MGTESVIARHPNQLIDVSVSNSWAVELAAATVGIVIVGTPTDEQTDLYILLTQDGTAGRVAKWPGTVTFSGSPPQPTSGSPVLVHLVTTDGVNWQQAPTQSAPGAGGSGNATEIQGVAVSATPPADGQSLVFSEDDDEYVPSGTSVQTPEFLAIGINPPGGSQASYINEGLETASPITSIFDGAPLPGTLVQEPLVSNGSVILAGTFPQAGTFIGHDLNLVYRSTDKGANWTGIVTPWDAGLGSGALVSSIVFGAADAVFAAGVDESGNWAAMKSVDLGLTWSVVTTPIDGTPASTLASTYPTVAYDGTDYYLAVPSAIGGTGLWSTPDLATFTGLTTGIDAEAIAGVVATSTVVLAIGYDAATVSFARSVDHGVTWTNPANPFANFVAGMVFPDGNGNWLAWYQPTVGLIQSLDDGATWGTPLALPSFANAVGIGFLPGTGWVSVWGPTIPSVDGVSGGQANGYIIYSAPVAEPQVWTPTGYVSALVASPYACPLIPVS